MAGLGSGRKYSFGFIENLRESEVVILKAMLNWNHAAYKANYRSIAAKCNIASSTVSAALFYLSGRGIVKRSLGRSWFIMPEIKAKLIQEFGHTDLVSPSEQAQHTPEQNNQDPSDPAE